MPSWRLRNLLNVRLLAGVLCLTGMGVAAGAGPTRPTLQSETQPADKNYEIVRMSKPDGTVVEMRVPRHRSLSAKPSVAKTSSVRRLPGTAAAGEVPEATPRVGGRRAVTLGQRATTPRASSEGPVASARADAGRRDSGRVVTQRANTGARISHPYTGSRQLTSDVVDLMRPTAVPRGGAVSQTPVVASDNASEWRTGLGWAPNNEDDDTGRYLSEDDAFAELEPGDGWDGPTDDPDPVGDDSMPGWDAKAIARWDVVPYQTFDEAFHIGVVAFHINGIDRVDFSVDGGPWVSVDEMQLNPRTDVWEYTAVLRPEFFEDDGLVEVRAIVWPEGAGVARVLAGPIENSLEFRNGNHSMLLSANGGGTLPSPEAWADAINGSDETGVVGDPDRPFRTPYRALYKITEETGSSDGATVYLKPGEYTWGREEYMQVPVTSIRWATITPATGTLSEEVHFYQETSGGFRTRLVRTKQIRFDESEADLSLRSNPGSFVWIDDCIAIGKGPDYADTLYTSTAYNHRVYVTNTHIQDYRSGIRAAELYRSCTIENISGSPFGAGAMVLACTVQDYNDPMNFHGDVFHWSGETDDRENFIVFNLSATNFWTQALFATYDIPSSTSRMDNVAFVNVHVSKGAGRFIDGNIANGSWWEKSTNHLLIWHVTMPEHQMRWNVEEHDNELLNISVIGSVFQAFVRDRLPTDAVVQHNHFIEDIHDSYIPSGPNALDNSFGGSIYTLFNHPDPLNGQSDGDYRPLGALLTRVINPPVPFDLNGSPRTAGAPVGAVNSNVQ